MFSVPVSGACVTGFTFSCICESLLQVHRTVMLIMSVLVMSHYYRYYRCVDVVLVMCHYYRCVDNVVLVMSHYYRCVDNVGSDRTDT